MSRFSFTALPLADLGLVERKCVSDDRGFLSRLFCSKELAAIGWRKPVAQINQTYTRFRGTVRGLHYQTPPFVEMKLVSVMRGEIWDVAIDLRAGSPSYLQWHAEVLSASNNRSLLIPEGFAHGFQALTDDVEMLYCHSSAYNPGAEGGFNPLDEGLGIEWPLAVSEMSARDRAHPAIDKHFAGLSV